MCRFVSVPKTTQLLIMRKIVRNGRVHFKLSLYNFSVIARQLVVEAIQCKRCILDCFVPRNDGMRKFEIHPYGSN